MLRIRKLIREELQLLDKKTYNFMVIDETPEVPKKFLQVNYAIDDASVHEAIVLPLKYLMKTKGKNIRADFITSFAGWYDIPEEAVTLVLEFVHLYHNYSLLIDDIQDASYLRRGSPAAHLLYGIPHIMNSVSYLIALTSENILRTKNPIVLKASLEAFESAWRGQASEINWRNNGICPTEDEYKLMAIRKTGCFIRFITRCLAGFSTKSKDCLLLSSLLGLHFQIKDDLNNLINDQYHKTKGFCEDITKGKFSFPIIYVINNFPEEGEVVKDILKRHTIDIETLKYCRSVIEKTGAFAYTAKVLKEYKICIEEECDKLGPNAAFRKKVLNGYLHEDFVLVF